MKSLREIMADLVDRVKAVNPIRVAVVGAAQSAVLETVRAAHSHRRLRAPAHVPFAVVLCGGGARGLSHVGVLKALEHYGYRPEAIVGVSMGAIVGVSYGLNPDWYTALLNMDTSDFPDSPSSSREGLGARMRAVIATERLIRNMLVGWGVGSRSLAPGKALLRALTRKRKLEDSRIPLAVVATDLYSGQRVVLTRGNAADAAYASSALPGILPPLAHGEYLLADGAYVDQAPIDVARGFGVKVVIAVDPSQTSDTRHIRNGLQAMLRGVEICHLEHTRLRLEGADLVLRPRFPFPIDTLDFSHKRTGVAAGARAVRAASTELERLLGAGNLQGRAHGERAVATGSMKVGN
ncbi:MAG: hypothetical protein BMS9Abin10_1029 [Gammaproteobacteria bacterium]|nr:MAG: hypothetical protein BMS9Abin10_1029 [Gammaproteobacteria bacterium]